jgi:hypothetical protein
MWKAGPRGIAERAAPSKASRFDIVFATLISHEEAQGGWMRASTGPDQPMRRILVESVAVFLAALAAVFWIVVRP